MKHIFLIDYENVSDSGLEGFFDLTPADTVYLFYTVKACKIGIDFVDLLRKQDECARLHFIRAATGNQALDFQLSSFLGALITENTEPDCAFHIISKDKGYTCLLSFWANMRPGVQLSILPRIAEETRRRPKPQPAAVLPKAEAVPLPIEPEAEAAVAVSAAVQVEEAAPAIAVPTLPEASPAPLLLPETAAAAPEGAVEAPQAEAGSAAEKQPQRAKAPSAKRSRRAKTASPAKSEAADPQPGSAESSSAEAKTDGRKALAAADRAVMNTAVQQVLSKAKYDNTIISSAASLVIKMYKDGTNMQELYRGIIRSFGREQGLEVYNLIKPVLM